MIWNELNVFENIPSTEATSPNGSRLSTPTLNRSDCGNLKVGSNMLMSGADCESPAGPAQAVGWSSGSRPVKVGTLAPVQRSLACSSPLLLYAFESHTYGGGAGEK